MTPPYVPTVLVVDDDRGLVILIERALRAEQWNVVTASSGAEALAWLQGNSPQLILLDLKLHDLDGRDFIRMLDETGRSTPFLIITGQGDDRVAVDMMKRGALDYLVKDVNFMEFLPTVVRSALERVADEERLIAAEVQLQEQKRRYQSLVEMSPDAIFVAQNDGITFINAAGLRLFGAKQPAQVIGKSPLDFFHPDPQGTFQARMEALLKGDGSAFMLEEKLTCLNGAIRSVEVLAAAFPHGATSAVQLVVRDITGRKRNELRRHLQLETSRILAASDSMPTTLSRLLQGLAEAMQWKVGEFWEVTGSPGTLRVVQIWHQPGSRKLAQFVKQSRRLSLSMFDGLPGQVMATRMPQWISNLAECTHFHRRAQAQQAGLRSALAFPILLDREVRGVMAFLTTTLTEPDEDLLEMFVNLGRQMAQFMERKKFEEALQQSETRFRSTLDNMMEGCQTIGFDWRYQYLNKTAAHHGRQSIHQLLGRRLMDVFPGVEQTRLFACLKEALVERNKTQIENQFTYPDGDSAWFQLSIQPVPEGVFILSLDITERKKLERELLDLSERKQREFGHDLHDGLGQRLTGLEMLSHGLASDLKRQFPALAGNAARLNRELRETVTQARLISHGLAPVPLEGDGLMRGLKELAASTGRMGRTSCRFRCDPPVSVADVAIATHLYRIAQEAVNNALKHGKPKQIRITLSEGNEGLKLIVENDGRAMRVASKRGATGGMGLNIMRYRAEMIGADLDIRPGRRKGVRIACTLRKNP